MNKMFCFQCEQTAGCTGCTGSAGVCGKKADIALLQDRLTGSLIGLARALGGNEDLITPETDKLFVEGLFTAVTNVNFNNETINALIERIEAEKRRIVPTAPCAPLPAAELMITICRSCGTQTLISVPSNPLSFSA